MVYLLIVNLLWGFLGYVTAKYFDMDTPWTMFSVFYLAGCLWYKIAEIFKNGE